MFVRSAKWLMVIALVLTLGGHWAILQTAAWIGMTISYSADSSLSTALTKTFNGKNPCKLCKVVSAGKKSEKKSETRFESKKLDSFLALNFGFHFPPAKQFPFFFGSALPLRSEVPPSPPPRFA